MASRSRLSTVKRREHVEAAIREHGWSEALVIRLMAETGAARSTLYDDKDAIAKVLAAEERAGLDDRRALFLVALRKATDKALTSGAFSATARLLAMEAQLLGIDQVPLPEVEEETGPVDSSLEGLLTTVRRLRRRAEAGNSFVAASKFLEQEQGVVEAIRQRDEAEKARAMAHLDESGLIELFISNAARLPDNLKARLRDALST